jgi:hypothetical protein
MILDAQTLLSGSINATTGVISGQLITANSTLSTNTIDLNVLTLGNNQAHDAGLGESLKVTFSILVAPATATDVTFQLIQADDAALSSNVQVLAQTGAYTIAQLPAGSLVTLHYGIASPLAPKRYIGARYIATGTTITAMSVVAGVIKDAQSLRNIHYRSGFSVT